MTSSIQYVYHSSGEEDTARLASALAVGAFPSAVIAVDGDLGAGKTRFAQAFARELGVRDLVNSPTFTLIREYEGRLPFYHMDVYRLTEEEADELGLDDYFYGDGVTLVEWAGRIGSLLPPEHLKIGIVRTGETEREIRLHPLGASYTGWCDQLKRSGVLA